MKKTIARSRRTFLQQSLAAGIGGLALPTFVPRHVLASPAAPGANDRVNIALVGMKTRGGQIATNLPAAARIVAVCDVDLARAESATRQLKGDWKIYQDYCKILDKEPVDGMVLCMCDHNRILPAIHCCQAGKDVYVEKPFCLYVAEGRTLVQAVQHYKRICQHGTQSRTIGTNQTALRMIREGKLGKLQSITCRNYSAVLPYKGGPAQPKPEKLDWDKWCGQTELFPFNETPRLKWSTFSNYCGGGVGFLGAHAYDMIQCALGADETGPVELWTTSPAGPDAKVRMKYANGFEVSLEADSNHSPYVGGIFTCEHGKIELNEHLCRTNPPELRKEIPPMEQGEVGYRPGWMGTSHLANWLDCIRTRKRPHAYEEIGQRSATVCHLVGITKKLGRRLHWDPAAERFLGDDEASALLSRPRRKGYELPALT